MDGAMCDYCDGCGWTEGGETLQTVCVKCAGTGASPPPPSPRCPTCGNGQEDMECSNAFHIAPPSPPVEPPVELLAWLDYLGECDPETPGWKQARSALESLYTRQREEIERQEEDNVDLSSQLERLKADSLTAEEAGILLGLTFRMAGTQAEYAAREKLKQISLGLSSDSGTGGEG